MSLGHCCDIREVRLQQSLPERQQVASGHTGGSSARLPVPEMMPDALPMTSSAAAPPEVGAYVVSIEQKKLMFTR